MPSWQDQIADVDRRIAEYDVRLTEAQNLLFDLQKRGVLSTPAELQERLLREMLESMREYRRLLVRAIELSDAYISN